MPITVSHQPDAMLVGRVAGYGGYGQYLDRQRQRALQETELLSSNYFRNQQQQLAARGQQADTEARWRQQALQAADMQQRAALAARQQDIDVWRYGTGLQFQAAMEQQREMAGALQWQRQLAGWDYQYSRQQQDRMGEYDRAQDYLDQMRDNLGFSPNKEENDRMYYDSSYQIAQARAGMKPTQQLRQPEFDMAQHMNRYVRPVPGVEGAFFVTDPKTQDIRIQQARLPEPEPVEKPPPPPKPVMTPQLYVHMMQGAFMRLRTQAPDGRMVNPEPEAVKKLAEEMMRDYMDLAARLNSPQITGQAVAGQQAKGGLQYGPGQDMGSGFSGGAAVMQQPPRPAAPAQSEVPFENLNPQQQAAAKDIAQVWAITGGGENLERLDANIFEAIRERAQILGANLPLEVREQIALEYARRWRSRGQ